MPALTMRGRYLMREYWGDSDLFLRLTADERELYIGLWMLADDEGWMPWDVPAVARAMYQYLDREPREALVRSVVAKLVRIGKVDRQKCCLFLPAVARYPRAGRKNTDHADAHRTHLKVDKPPTPKGDKGIRTVSNPSPVPSPSLPDVAPARAPDGAAGGLKAMVEAAGFDPAVLIGGKS